MFRIDSSRLVKTVLGFFFQAEDGIRDIGVTGVQTCALPISLPAAEGVLGQVLRLGQRHVADEDQRRAARLPVLAVELGQRSEERRVGKERRSRWTQYH